MKNKPTIHGKLYPTETVDAPGTIEPHEITSTTSIHSSTSCFYKLDDYDLDSLPPAKDNNVWDRKRRRNPWDSLN